MKKLAFRTLFMAPVLFIIVGVNYWIDPTHLYSNAYYDRIGEIITTSNVLISGNCDENRLVETLAKHKPQPRTLVIGSSRCLILDVDVVKDSTLLNLSSSGADLEDIIATLTLYESQFTPPDHVILGLDPWMLNANRGSVRFHGMAKYFNKSARQFGLDTVAVDEEQSMHYKELISLENFQNSLLSVRKYGWREMMPTPIDGRHKDAAVRASSGAIKYPSGWQTTTAEIDMAAKRYISNEWVYGLNQFEQVSEERLQVVRRILAHLASQGTVVTVFLSPYHPMVQDFFSKDNYYAVVQHAEMGIKKLCKGLNVTVVGGYDPRVYQLSSSDFYDGMHVNPLGLKKVVGNELIQGPKL